MDKKTACYFQNGSPKLFELFPETQLEEFGKRYFKVDSKSFVVACLTRYTPQGGFTNLTDKVPQDPPSELYFYALTGDQELNFFRIVTVRDTTDPEKQYRFRMLVTDTFKAVDSKFKAERNPLDKTPFSYILHGQQLPPTTVLSQFDILNIRVDAVPKVTNLEVFEDGKMVFKAEIATSHFKKKARQLVEKVVAQQLNRDAASFQNYEVFYEYCHKKIPQQETVAPKHGETVKLNLNSPHNQFQETVLVEVILENGDKKRKQLPLEQIRYKLPNQIASFVVDQSQLEQKLLGTTVDSSRTLSQGEYFKQGKQISIRVTSPLPSQNNFKGYQVPGNRASSEWEKFKGNLRKHLNDFPESEKNDKEIKTLIADFMRFKLCQ